MRKEIEELLKSDISAYRISKETGVSQGNISEMRKGLRDIGNLTLNNAEKLYEFYCRIIKTDK